MKTLDWLVIPTISWIDLVLSVLIFWETNPTYPTGNRTSVSRVTGRNTHHYTTKVEFNKETVLFNKKCLQSLLNNGDYRQVSIFFQTTFMNLTHYILSIFKLRMSKRISGMMQRKRARPINQRSLDRNHSLLCINHLVFESNNFKLKVIMKLFFFFINISVFITTH